MSYKKLLLYGAGLLGLGLVLLLLSRFVRLPLLGVAPEAAIPRHAALVLHGSKSRLALAAGSKISAQAFIPASLAEDLASFDSIFGRQLPVQPNEPLLCVVQPTRSSGMDVLFILDERRGLELEALLSGAGKGWQLRSSVYKNQEIFTVKAGAGNSFALTKFRNLLLFARHAYLLENAVRQIKDPASNLCRHAGFRRLFDRADGEADHLNVFLNLAAVPRQFAPLLLPSGMSELQRLAGIGDWLHLQLPLTEQSQSWQAALSSNEEHPLLRANASGPTLPYHPVFRTLPNNLTAFAWLTLRSLQPASLSIRWDRHFKHWMGDELILARGEPIASDGSELFLLLEAKDPAKAEAALAEFARATRSGPASDFQMFKIQPLKGNSLWKMLGLRENLGAPVACSLGDYLLFSNSRAGLERWLGKYIAGQTLSRDVEFLQLITPLPTKSQGFIYARSGPAWQAISAFFPEEQLAELPGSPLRFQHLAGTLTRSRELCEWQILTPDKADSRQEADYPVNVLWETALESPVRTTPFLFRPPRREGESDIFVQDEQNTLYLISRIGQIRWQRQLEEPITSQIYQLDLYNNREAQLAFSTRTGIHLLDSEGEYPAGFPLALQVPAANGVTIVDFFKSNDYQFFIACENGMVYGFDEKGSPVEGWRPKSDAGLVRHPLVHFQAEGKDFMVLMDTSGSLQVFQKNGATRFEAQAWNQYFPQGPAYQTGIGPGRIVACDESGRVHVSNLQGDGFSLKPGIAGGGPVRFLFSDVAGDGRKDYLFLSGRELSGYYYRDNKFERAFSYRMEVQPDLLFEVAWPGARKQFIGTVCREKQQLHLFNGRGKLLPQFPLAGTTSFVVTDLSGNGQPVLLAGNGNRLVAYAFERTERAD
jgi:hypothetical protein